MADKAKVIKAIECCVVNNTRCFDDNDKLCPYFTTKVYMCEIELLKDALALLKEQEAVEPTINEDGEAYCICGENVGIIPNSKSLPSVRLKYCPECGRRMKWE